MLRASGGRLELPIGHELGHVGFVTNNGCGGAPWHKAQFRGLNVTATGASDKPSSQWSGDEPGHSYHRSPASDHAGICCLTSLGEGKGVAGTLKSTLFTSTDGKEWRTAKMTKPWVMPVVWNADRLESYNVSSVHPFTIKKSFSTDSVSRTIVYTVVACVFPKIPGAIVRAGPQLLIAADGAHADAPGSLEHFRPARQRTLPW